MAKLKELTEILQDQCNQIGFSTFSPSDFSLSEDSYKPEKEGSEIGFETSASDAIRLKGAYQLSLLELSEFPPTNKLGLLIFDEPRQQSSLKISFGSILQRASAARDRNQQVIFSTSEERDLLSRMKKDIDCEEIIFLSSDLQKMEAVHPLLASMIHRDMVRTRFDSGLTWFEFGLSGNMRVEQRNKVITVLLNA